MNSLRSDEPIPWWIEEHGEAGPPREILNRAVITAAALTLADAEGLGALSMRRVADQLGVQAGSLYRHFENKDELLAAVVDGLLAHVEVPGPDAPWPDVLRMVGKSYRRLLRRHPSLLSPPLSDRQPGPNALRVLEGVLSPLTRAGFTPVQAVSTSTAVTNLAAGLVQQEVRQRDAARASRWAQLAKLPPSRFETIVEVSAALKEGDEDEIFEFALDSLIEGLKVQLRAATRPKRTASRR